MPIGPGDPSSCFVKLNKLKQSIGNTNLTLAANKIYSHNLIHIIGMQHTCSDVKITILKHGKKREVDNGEYNKLGFNYREHKTLL